MKDFTTFREDLASGRPMKKPVTSNLLKNRRKENEKALKSGFMKMPDYAKKKFNEEEEMKPHKMYKGDKVVMAKNKAEHDKLNKQGYTHDNPKTKKVEEEKKNCGCGQDPCITYGKGGKKEMKEQSILEVSDALKTRYIHKAMRDVDNKERAAQLADKQGAPASVGKSLSKSTGKRRQGIAKARANLERPIKEQEQLDELSPELKKRYIKKRTAELDSQDPAGYSPNPEGTRRKGIARAKGHKMKGVSGIYYNRHKDKVEKPIKEEKQKGIDGKVCWKGYKRMGTKKKGGKTVDNCVKVENFIFDALEKYYEKNLQELSPKTISSYQKKAGKQYRDLKNTTPSRQGIENAYHQGYTSDKEYFKQHDDRDKMKKRGKGLAMSKGKGVQKEAYTVKTGSKQEADKLNDKAHAALGYKKTSDSGLKKVKGGYERKRTYTKEGAMKRLATDKAEKDRLQLRKLKKAVNSKPEPSAYRFPDKDGKATPLYRKEQMQLVTNLDLEESIANLVKRGVGKVKDTLQQAGAQYKDHQEKQMKAGKGIYSNPVSGKNIAKRLYGQPQKKR